MDQENLKYLLVILEDQIIKGNITKYLNKNNQ
jgi:hypothetical protein